MGPRASFVAFDQINRFRCRPWAEEDETSALALAELLEHVYGAELAGEGEAVGQREDGDGNLISNALVREERACRARVRRDVGMSAMPSWGCQQCPQLCPGAARCGAREVGMSAMPS